MAVDAVYFKTEREKGDVGTILHLSSLRSTSIWTAFRRLSLAPLARCEIALAWRASLACITVGSQFHLLQTSRAIDTGISRFSFSVKGRSKSCWGWAGYLLRKVLGRLK